MEERLKNLIEGNSERNRTKWAMEWKNQGKKVIGVLSSYVPEEVIYAAGMLPWRVTGTWQSEVSRALNYRPARSRLYCTHVLESLLSGEYDFLDGVVTVDTEQEMVRLWDVWAHLKKTPFTHIMHLPHTDSELGVRQFQKETKQFVNVMGKLAGKEITAPALRRAISKFDIMRGLLTKLYELQKRDVPPLSGAEVLGIVTAAAVMPKDDFNRELKALLPYIKTRKTSLGKVHPRLLVSSDIMDNPAYLELVEELGCVVAMDDMDPGSKYFWQMVDSKEEDPVSALGRRYLTRPGGPRMVSWDKQVEQVINWVKEYKIDAVLELPEMYSIPCGFRAPFFAIKLKEAGIPNISLKRDYHLGNAAQLKTRIGAFLEMLGQ